MQQLWAAILLVLVFDYAQSNKYLDKEQEILEKIFKEYDASIRPKGVNETGPVFVEVNTYVRSMTNIDDVKMVYNTQLTFRQRWQDSRLKYDVSKGMRYVTLTRPEKLWIPDLFFSNEMTGQFHNIITPNNLIRIFPDGTVLYSTRISMSFFCPMDLKNYPLDNQVCSISCASYGYTTDDIVFFWKNEDPVQVTKNLYMSKFSLNKFMTDTCTSKTNTGEYSCIKLDFHLSRDFTYYLLQAYMPTTALVLLSWVAFWLNPRSTIIRLGIWVGVLLAIIIVTTSLGTSGPQVSYIKAIDVWMGVCVTFIFCVLIELCLVNNAVTRDDKIGLQNQLAMEEALSEKTTMCVDDHAKNSRLTSFTSTPLRWLNKYSTNAQRIDAVCRVLFPAAFAFFNFVYWLTYTAK